MAELVYEETLVASEDLVAGDEFKIGDVLVIVAKVQTNAYDNLVLTCGIVGATTKRRNAMTLIMPKKIPIIKLS